MYIRTYIRMCTGRSSVCMHCVHIRTYVCMHMQTYVCTYVHMHMQHTHMYIHTNICMYVCTYVHTYAHADVRTYVRTLNVFVSFGTQKNLTYVSYVLAGRGY